MERYQTEVTIDAPIAQVWLALTSPALMERWMGDGELGVEVETDWQVGSELVIRGYRHDMKFENRGTVRRFDPPHHMSYDYLSSLSRLPDVPESYVLLDFTLEAISEGQTRLSLCASEFPDVIIAKHVALYWGVTLRLLGQQIERGAFA